MLLLFAPFGLRAEGDGRHANFDSSDPYTIMGVPRSMPLAQIESNYRLLSKQNHPDREQDKSRRIVATARQAILNLAIAEIREEHRTKPPEKFATDTPEEASSTLDLSQYDKRFVNYLEDAKVIAAWLKKVGVEAWPVGPKSLLFDQAMDFWERQDSKGFHSPSARQAREKFVLNHLGDFVFTQQEKPDVLSVLRPLRHLTEVARERYLQAALEAYIKVGETKSLPPLALFAVSMTDRQIDGQLGMGLVEEVDWARNVSTNRDSYLLEMLDVLEKGCWLVRRKSDETLLNYIDPKKVAHYVLSFYEPAQSHSASAKRNAERCNRIFKKCF